MSTISSSKSGQSGRPKDRNKGQEGSQYGQLQEDNPFKIPPDEKIFTFKEEEKERKNEEREQNKNMKIWEKNRPTREGCLRKICETDIEPSALAINPKVQKKINVAEAAGFTIPIERPKNRENRYKLIEKKREMFLVSQMLETKQEEIQRLELHAYMREDGLNCSERMLAQDTNSFIQFFNKIKDETTEAQKRLDELKKLKNAKTGDFRSISDEYNVLVSNINKNLESLQVFYGYKQFLDQLAPKEIQDQMEYKKQLRQRRKEEQIRREQLGSSGGQGKGGDSKGKKDGKKEKKSGFQANGTDNEVNIPAQLKDVIEESDDEYPLYFQNPDELLEIFQILEESNLFLIQQGQESEQALESKKHELDSLKFKYDIEMGKLKTGQEEIKDRINKTDVEKNFLQNTTQDEQNKVIDQTTFALVDQNVKELYTIVLNSKAEGKMSNSSILQLLNEIEKEIDGYLFEFQVSDMIDPNFVKDESKKIQQEIRKVLREEKQIKQNIEKAEKQRKKLEEKNSRKFVKVGKPTMHRSDKEQVKRVREVKRDLTEEQLDLRKYLELI